MVPKRSMPRANWDFCEQMNRMAQLLAAETVDVVDCEAESSVGLIDGRYSTRTVPIQSFSAVEN